jgi:SPP1 gp7 family putative phage head morphogenesis protein
VVIQLVITYTDEELEQLESEERAITDEAIAIILLILMNLKTNIENELRKFYQEYGKDGIVTYTEARKWVDSEDHRKRLFVLYLALNVHFMNAKVDIESEYRKFLEKVILKESDFFNLDLDVEKLLNKTWGNDDLNWLDRLQDDFEYYEAKLFKTVKDGFVRKMILEDVFDELEKVMKSFASKEEALAITESTTINSLARKEVMKAKGAKRYRFYAREDERTCEHCGSLHGLVFPIAQFEVGVTASPVHPRCRCWEVPIIE